jgi:hypothetical protein
MSLVVAYRTLLRCPDCGAVEEQHEMSIPAAAEVTGVAGVLGTVAAACGCAEGAAVLVESVDVAVGDVGLTVGADGRLYADGGVEMDAAGLAALLRAALPIAA